MELKRRRKKTSSESGQAITEYLILMTLIIAAYLALVRAISGIGLQKKLLSPINDDFAKAYQNGNTQAVGYDQGDPRNHPRAITGDKTNFRIFYNPGQ